jgi:L-lactate dehydrogenase
MKVGIVGAGTVGAACALAVVNARCGPRGRAGRSDAPTRQGRRHTDLRYGTPLSPVVDVRDGDFDDLASAMFVTPISRS